jgi:hypothetical protein
MEMISIFPVTFFWDDESITGGEFVASAKSFADRDKGDETFGALKIGLGVVSID